MSFSVKKKAPKTELPEDKSSFKGSVVSDADRAKVLNNLDILQKEYEENSSKRQKTFISDLSKALLLRNNGNNSNYADYIAVSGEEVTIRLSDHNVSVTDMDNAGKSNGISIVIGRKHNDGIKGFGNSHIIEFYYNNKKLHSAEGNPYTEIIQSLKQTVYSGEYKDTTGLAERQEVNGISFRIGRNGEFSKENNGIRFSVKPVGGNRGYVGYSMSKRAAQARGEGRFPKTDFKKEYGVSDKALDFLVASGIVDNSEWHHTSMYGNKTTFYGWSDASYPDYYAEHKAEIDNAAREYASAEGDVRKSLREDMQGKFGAAEEAWHEADRLRRERAHEKWLEKVEYEKYVRNLGVPSEYEASNGVRVVTQGSGSPYSWQYYWGEEPAFRKYARAAEEELKQHLKENKPTPLSFEEWKEKNGGVSFSVKEGRLTKNLVEENFGGIWIEDKKEFAKFASAVRNYGIEENGEGVTYTDNFFYGYYRNINGDAIPFASVYLNSQESQDVVNKVSKEIGNGREEGGIKKYIDTAIERYELLQNQNYAYNGNNSGVSNRGGNVRLGDSLLQKGRYYYRPDLYVKTERADRFGLIDEEDPDLSFRTAPSFKDGEQLPVQGEKGAYFVEGLTGGYQNADYLLDAFRSKYPEYLAELNEDKTAIVVEPWSKYLGPTTSKRAKAKGWYDTKTHIYSVCCFFIEKSQFTQKTMCKLALTHYY